MCEGSLCNVQFTKLFTLLQAIQYTGYSLILISVSSCGYSSDNFHSHFFLHIYIIYDNEKESVSHSSHQHSRTLFSSVSLDGQFHSKKVIHCFYDGNKAAIHKNL